MAGAAPEGTVTLVFTDVQGSTALWDRSPEVMRRALELHDRLLRDAIAAAGAYEVKTEGDAFMVAFASTQAAVDWCVRTQRALLAADWPEAILAEPEAAVVEDGGQPIFRGLRVRMGIHVGEPLCVPHPMTGRMDYFGPMVNRAARVAGAGHGGQILGSDWVRHLAGESPDYGLRDLGEHALKGLETPERIWQIVPAGLGARRFPPIKTDEVRRTNLGAPGSALIGRRAELERLAGGVQRLVTVLGPPGVGKTRLAREHAWRCVEAGEHDGGVWVCDLSATATVAEVTAQIAGVAFPNLSLRPPREVEQLGRVLAGKGRVLLVLDDAERAAGALRELLGVLIAAAPELEILTTSRQRLGLPDERCLELSPLPVDDAVELFAARARAAAASVDDERSRDAIAAVVERLDCLPLAVELAAARSRVLSPAQQRDRLEREGTSRLRGLEGALASSWQLLAGDARRALARCALFCGSFELAAAEHLFEGDGLDALDLIGALRDCSLVSAREEDGELRFFLLQSVRAFAAARLAEDQARAELVSRWAGYYADLGDELARAATSKGSGPALARLALERANLLAVARAPEVDPNVRLRAILAVDRQLTVRGPVALRRQTLALVDDIEGADPALHLRALTARIHLGRVSGGSDDCERSVALARELAPAVGDTGALARFETELGALCGVRGDLDAARAGFDRALELARAAGDQLAECLALDARSLLLAPRASLSQTIADMERAVAIASRLGDRRVEARLRNNLGVLYQGSGRTADAARAYRPARELARALGDPRLHGLVLSNLGSLCNDEGRPNDARELCGQALDELGSVGDTLFSAHATLYLGVSELLRGDLAAAADTLGAAAELERDGGLRRYEGLCALYLGVVQLLAGSPEQAGASLDAAAGILADCEDGDQLALALAWRALTRARTGARAAAADDAARAAELARQRSDTLWLGPCVDALGAAALGQPWRRAELERDSQDCRLALVALERTPA